MIVAFKGRFGTTITEMVVALAVLGAVLVALGEFAAGTAQYRRRGAAQRLVAQEANNFLEQVVALPAGEVTEQRVGELAKQYEADELRPVDLDVRMRSSEPADAPVEQVRITVTAEHRSMANVRCELTVWKHRSRSETP